FFHPESMKFFTVTIPRETTRRPHPKASQERPCFDGSDETHSSYKRFQFAPSRGAGWYRRRREITMAFRVAGPPSTHRVAQRGRICAPRNSNCHSFALSSRVLAPPGSQPACGCRDPRGRVDQAEARGGAPANGRVAAAGNPGGCGKILGRGRVFL